MAIKLSLALSWVEGDEKQATKKVDRRTLLRTSCISRLKQRKKNEAKKKFYDIREYSPQHNTSKLSL
ncbi:CLUMA_CG009595, isoform A [Clunio marinus]|uniref:CLUMA_CG009595, isoform A n=1 Tax=Clunio marinus TaxID=568069 RepID=A0A1J1IB19_9DIPT|nr:CLUMA_CG009595, isoform A [Clunio marinus]